MKRTLVALLLVSATLSWSAGAQTNQLTWSNLNSIRTRNALETFPVQSTNGSVVAQLSDVIFNLDTSQPAFGVLYLFGNIENTAVKGPFTVVPWQLFQYDGTNGQILVQISPDKLRQAPIIPAERVPPVIRGNWGRELYDFYGVTPEPVAAAAGASGAPAGVVHGREHQLPDSPNPFGVGEWVFLVGSVLLGVFAVFLLARRSRRPV